MAYVPEILVTAGGGVALGLFFFGGLWFTVQRLGSARRPALLMLGSLAARLAVCLPCFILAARGGQLGRLLLFTAAFLATRLALTRRLGPGGAAAATTVADK